MTINHIVIPKKIRPQLKDAWLPQVAAGEGRPQGSRFGGRPWLPQGTVWPNCPHCGLSMQLFVQLDLATMPGESPQPPDKLLQLFYCTNLDGQCESVLENDAPFGRGVVARRVSAEADGALGTPNGIDPFEPSKIITWYAYQDAPHWEDRECELTEEEEAILEAAEVPIAGDKWLGWPNWIQGADYPSCRICGDQMTYLLQIDSECNLPWMFGDSGIGHLSVCANHPDEMSFHWACC